MYLVFLYHELLPQGGINDCKAVFTTEDQCRDYIEGAVTTKSLKAQYYSVSDNIVMVYNPRDKTFRRDNESEIDI